jgi:asparagine synthase (glutamine-hydrolysing)
MAGLVGIVGADAADRLPAMLAALQRPGPDEASWSEGAAALAWRGVAVATPHLVVEPDVVIVLAGSIDPDEGEDPHGVLPPVPDARRLLAAWRRYGIDLVERVQGDFVAAIYERGPATLHVVRDRTGQRPILWARRGDQLAFASDLDGLLAAGWISRELARDHLAEYLSFRLVHAPRTLLREVSALEPGHRLRFSDGTVRLVRYFRPTYAAPGTPVPREADVLPELNAAIDRSVRRQIAGEGSVGVYLSGGVGSTAVAAAARSASRSLKTFTVTFAEEQFPEFPFAGRVAKLLNMEHQTISVGSKEIADEFEPTVAALGLPNGNVSAVLQLMLARAARAGVDRVLTGDGADQLFGGAMLEGPAQGLARVERFHALPSALRQVLAVGLRRSDAWRDVLTPPSRWALEQGIGGVHLFDPKQRRSLLLDGLFVHPAIRRDVLAPFYDEVDTDPLNGVMHAFLRSQLGADILPRVDGTAAAAGLAVCYPLLDARVQRLAMLLPGGFKVRGLGGSTTTRWLLRALLRGALPPALINRPDRHMPRPLDDWLEGPGRLFMEERFASLRADPLRLWHTTGLEALRRALLQKQPGAAHRLWALFFFDAWARRVRVT